MELFPESADLVFFRGADANANKVSWQGDEFTRQWAALFLTENVPSASSDSGIEEASNLGYFIPG
jgi:hypothetical protein